MLKLLQLALFCLAVIHTCALLVENTERSAHNYSEFNKFMNTYNKAYKTIEEYEHRYNVFVKNYEDMIKMSELSGEKTTFGITQFFDMTHEEFAKVYLNLKTQNIKEMTGKIELKGNPKDVPESFDWRKENIVSKVKNQGSCGSCWAFSAVGNIEAIHAKKFGKLIEYSEQQLVDCDKVDLGCNGGLMEDAYKYIIEAKSLNTESDYPYEGRDETCSYHPEKGGVKLSGYKYAGSEDEEVIKQVLYENGPLAIAINATPLQWYFGGIYKPWFDWVCSPNSLNHGVLIVGYGVENGTKYWIVKNSWGSYWGESGYFRIFRGAGTCGVNKYVITAELADNQ